MLFYGLKCTYSSFSSFFRLYFVWLYMYSVQVMWLGQTRHKWIPVWHSCSFVSDLDLDVIQAGGWVQSAPFSTKQPGWTRQTDPYIRQPRVTWCCHGLYKWQITVFLWKCWQIVCGPAFRACWGSLAGLSHQLLSHGFCASTEFLALQFAKQATRAVITSFILLWDGS